MKKGITPIISIVILLLIAVAIAGAGYTWISGYWTGLTSEAIQITDVSCNPGDGVDAGTITIRYANIGTDVINLGPGDISEEVFGTGATNASLANPDPLNPGVGGSTILGGNTVDDPVEDSTYRYFITVGGRTVQTQVTC